MRFRLSAGGRIANAPNINGAAGLAASRSGNKGRAPRKLHKSTPTKRMKNKEFFPLNF